MYKYLLLLFTLLLSACCKDAVEQNSHVLADAEKESIPYLMDSAIEFSYSNGFEFPLTTISRQLTKRRTPSDHCGDNYSSFENLSVELRSSSPELLITLDVTPKEIKPNLTITINNREFNGDLTAAADIDTLTVNGTLYEHIYKLDHYSSDTLAIKPKQVLYNKTAGIIQILMTNNEKFTINE